MWHHGLVRRRALLAQTARRRPTHRCGPGQPESISLDGGEVEVLNEFADTYRLQQLPEPIEAACGAALPDVGFIEASIASRPRRR
ncbi:MAG: hypothetical protein R8J94_04960 [Acidimicrobiia bacterium]|nr:hypothetical protein [Acidimicrobiia bacterium]